MNSGMRPNRTVAGSPQRTRIGKADYTMYTDRCSSPHPRPLRKPDPDTLGPPLRQELNPGAFQRGLQFLQFGLRRDSISEFKCGDRPRRDPAGPGEVRLMPPEERSGCTTLIRGDWHINLISELHAKCKIAVFNIGRVAYPTSLFLPTRLIQEHLLPLFESFEACREPRSH